MKRTNSWELFGRLRSTLHAAPLGVQRWRWWLWEFKKLESECDAKLLAFVYSCIFYKHMPKTNSSWKPGFEKNLNFYYITFLPAKYVHFSMVKNHTNLQYVSMATKKTINGNHLCWGMEALQETVETNALTTDLFRPTPRNGPLPNVMNFEGI